MTNGAARINVTSWIIAAALLPACADDAGNDGGDGTDEGTETAATEADTDETADGDSGGSTGASADSVGTGNTSPGIEAARIALEPIVAAQCEHAFACCNVDEMAFQLGSAVADAEQCTDTTLAVLEAGGSPPSVVSSQIFLSNILPFFAYGLDPDDVVTDEDAFAACAAAILDQPCASSGGSEGDNCVAPQVAEVDACDFDLLFIGQRGVGEDCSTYSGFECAPGLSCDFYSSANGVCVEALSTGDSCFADYHCYGDLLCDYQSGTCVASAGPDEPCAYTNPDNPDVGTETTRCAGSLVCDPLSETCGSQTCAFGSSCNVESECPAGLSCVKYRCDLRGVTGEECYEDDDCATGSCVYTGFQNLCHDLTDNGDACQQHNACVSGFCDPNAGECAATISVDGACNPALPAEQCSDGFCDGANCVAFGDIGDMCPAVQCNYLADQQCWQGTCQSFPLPEGVPCGSSFDCQSGSCSTVCQPPPSPGDACTLGSCGAEMFCELADGNDGNCQPKRGRGAPCSSANQCWSGCEAVFGELRCYGNAPGIAFCDGA